MDRNHHASLPTTLFGLAPLGNFALFCFPLLPNWPLMVPKLSQHCLNIVPTWFQNGSNIVSRLFPNRPEVIPTSPYNCPNGPNIHPCLFYKGPNMVPRWSNNCTTMGLEIVSNILQKCPTTCPELFSQLLHICSNMLQTCSNCVSIVPESAAKMNSS